MKRTSDTDNEGEKRIRTDVDDDTSAASTQHLAPLKDGIVQEVRVANFMSFTSHKFRLVLGY